MTKQRFRCGAMRLVHWLVRLCRTHCAPVLTVKHFTIGMFKLATCTEYPISSANYPITWFVEEKSHNGFWCASRNLHSRITVFLHVFVLNTNTLSASIEHTGFFYARFGDFTHIWCFHPAVFRRYSKIRIKIRGRKRSSWRAGDGLLFRVG